MSEFHVMVGWIAMLLGVVSGAVIGLFFHEERWAGGYGSFRRRMMRLGHISFFGLGFLNLMFGFTLGIVAFEIPFANVASAGFVIGVISMPLCCFLTAWRKPFRHLFPIPVIAVLTGILPVVFAGGAA